MAQPSAAQYELNFRDYWRIFRKRKVLIVSIFIVSVAFSLYSRKNEVPLYQASSRIKLEQRQTVAGILLESSVQWRIGDPMENTAKIIASRPIAENAARHIGLLRDAMTPEEKQAAIDEVLDSVSTEREEDTNIIQIIATHTDPELAMKIANGVAETFVKWDLDENNKQARKAREFLQEQLVAVEKQLQSSEESLKAFKQTESLSEVIAPLSNQLAALKTELAELLVKATEKHPEVVRLKQRIVQMELQLKTIPGGETEYGRLVRDVKLNEQLFTLFKQKFEEARIAEAEKISDISIIDYASLPGASIMKGKGMTLLLGGFLGFLMGVIAAFFAENMDTSLSTIEGVETLLSVPVLAVIPHSRPQELKGSKKKWSFERFFLLKKREGEIDHKARLIVHDQPKSGIAESYRSLRTNLKFSEEVTGKSLIITSAGPQEGKSTVLINLGLTTAQMGARTLVIDSDLRRPTIYKTFKTKREPGLFDVITSGVSWQEAIQGLPDMLLGGMTLDEASKTPGLDHFFILPSGRSPLNPSEILGSREMDRLILELKKNFDVILYDAPPILPVTDAALIAPKVDGVILVYEIGRTARNALLRAKQQIESVGGKVLGVVLNHIKAETDPDTAYNYYHYRYYSPEKQEKTPETGTIQR